MAGHDQHKEMKHLEHLDHITENKVKVGAVGFAFHVHHMEKQHLKEESNRFHHHGLGHHSHGGQDGIRYHH